MAGRLTHIREHGIGRMNQKIDFYSTSGTDDGQGGKIAEVLNKVVTLAPAEVKEITGYKRIMFNQLVAGKPYEIWTRKRTDVTISETHVIGIGTRRLTIKSVVDDKQDKNYLYITAIEI